MRICSSDEMRKIDEYSEKEFGIDAGILMENAGRAASQVMLEKYPDAGIHTEILVIAGKGNNAGDAFVLARRLLGIGRRVRVFYLSPVERYPAAVDKHFRILKALGAKLVPLENLAELEEFFAHSPGPFTLIDGILGTGLKGNLEGFLYDLVELVNATNFREVISLDIPSGVDGDNGIIRGTAIQADLTVSFGFPKLGHFLAPGASKRGELINVDISLPHHVREEGDKMLLNDRLVSRLIQDRDRYGHKNSFGHTLLVGGSPGRLGAIEMAGRACHRMGTGLVTISTWDEIFPMLMMRMPSETMAFPIPTDLDHLDAPGSLLTGFSSIVVGPGLGQKPEAVKLLEAILANYQGPVVLDADALNIVAENNFFPLLVNRRAPTVLTPHLGEMARLLKISVSEIKEDLLSALRDAVDRTHSTIVLKGAATLICSPEDRVYLNHYPNDGMATAGSGDVLAGMIGGLLGQGMETFEAALAGVALHSAAGGVAAQTKGHRSMTASDIVDSISGAFHEIKERKTLAPLPFETRAYLL